MTLRNSSALLSIKAVSKAFGGVQALRDVSFDVAPGEIHALCGENGAGKSTLNKILSGSCVPDAGEATLLGRPLPFGGVAATEALGVAIVHQESTAFLHLDARDNIFVGREPRRFGGLFLDRARMKEETAQLLERLGERFDAWLPLGGLTLAQRQMVGIARALSHRCKLLILDEPTASLSSRETDTLFELLRRLRAEGVSILYVSHRLAEVFELADRVTVLRDGRWVATRPAAEVDRDELVRMMVGRDVSEMAGRSSGDGGATGAPLLEVQALSRDGAFRDVSFQVRAGEIVGVAGLVGAGRSEVARALFGIDRADQGDVRIDGHALPLGSTPAAMRLGIALVPEDRQRQGLALPMSVRDNLGLAVLRSLTRRGLLWRKKENDLAARVMGELTIRASSPAAPVESLSGGNQQKVLLGKWLARRPCVLILDEPTHGIDVGAKAEAHRLIRQLAGEGVAILLISSELPEILSMSDRVLVMREGAISGELTREEATQEKILALALPEGGGETKHGVPASTSRKEKPPKGGTTNLMARLAQQRGYGVLALLALTIAAVAFVNPAFLRPGNIVDMLVKCAPAAIVACGLTLVIVTREIDISVGSLMGLLAAVVGVLVSPQRLGWPTPAGAALTLAMGTAIGLTTGFLSTVGRVPSIIVTLGMLTALRGVTELAMGGEWITDLPSGLRYLGTGAWLGVPICVWTAAACIAFTSCLLRFTPLGRRVFAVGSNPRSAALAGLSPRRVRLFAFAFTGFLTAVATLVSVPQLSVIESGVGVGFELLVVTCVVVGGTSISGGKGTIAGSTLGVLLMGIISTVLIFLRLGPMATYWERAIQGAFILLAVLMDHLARRHSRSEAAE